MPFLPVPRPLGLALLPAALAVPTLPAAAQEVYQWKDANGVNRYSQTPPPGGQYRLRKIGRKATEAPPERRGATDTGKSAEGNGPSESPQCAAARGNIEILQGRHEVARDSDGDGRPDKTLDTAERKAQLELAHAMLMANCR